MNSDKNLVIWVNEEDHCKVISFEEGSDSFRSCYDRLIRCASTLSNTVQFQFHDKFGFLTLSPANIGTSLRLQVNLKLNRFVSLNNGEQKLNSICNEYDMDFKMDQSNIDGNVFEITNRCLLGKTEYQIVKKFWKGIEKILEVEFF
jgi:protein arginine kinase